MDFILPIVGFVVGGLVGLTGVGGASLLAPILIFLGYHPVMAIGTDLVYNSITKFFGMLQHLRQQTIKWKIVLYLSLGSLPGVLIATVLVQWIHIHYNLDWVFQFLLGATLLGLASLSFYKEYFSLMSPPSHYVPVKMTQSKVRKTILLSCVLGFIVGMTSIGSGSIYALVLLYLFSISGNELVGTDIAHAFFLTTIGGLVYFSHGNVEFITVLQLTLGSIPGVIVGSKITRIIPPKILRSIILVTIMVSGFILLIK
jgi:uncharacterized membrane protein YfcA